MFSQVSNVLNYMPKIGTLFASIWWDFSNYVGSLHRQHIFACSLRRFSLLRLWMNEKISLLFLDDGNHKSKRPVKDPNQHCTATALDANLP